MSDSTLKQYLWQLLREDEALYSQLCEAGLVPSDDAQLMPEHLETARVVRTLVQELEVNWAGVEVIMHMRTQLITTRKQLAELSEQIRSSQTPKSR